MLNLSYNHFEGAVPFTGIFTNASVISLVGNGNLCGGIPGFHLPRCPSDKPAKKLSLKSKVIIIIISLIAVLSIAALLATCLVFRRLRKKRGEFAANPDDSALLKISYQNLLTATNRFSSENLIGTGSFGSVYKGILEERIIVVKVLNLTRKRGARSFIAECEALKNIRHRNLVKLITACSSADFQGNDFKALIYEFMENGSLEEWLHPSPALDDSNGGLNLLQRLNIAIDVASALEYLHNFCETTIVHCDIKPSNILLDGEMIGHVGDFGLAKILADNALQLSFNQSSSIVLRGTVGYAPPEYGMGGEVSTYGDVYSYGILLLEMFTGKKPTDEMFGENLNLHNFVRTGLRQRVAEIGDPPSFFSGLLAEIVGSQSHGIARNDDIPDDCLVLILQVGIACSVDSPQERMNISDAVAQLCSVRKKLLGMLTHQ